MKLTFVGSGDAFGSGGRFNTCFHLARSGGDTLIDLGATSLVALRRIEIEPNSISTIVLSHLHGDHFGGIPFFLLDAQFVSRRSADLVIAGPVGTAERIDAAMEVFFPGSSQIEWRFGLEIVEMPAGRDTAVGGMTIGTVEVNHPSGAPSLALRLHVDGRVVAFSGDTEWVDALADVSRDADLFICECYMYERSAPYHLDYNTIVSKLPLLQAKRMILTHLGPSMLENTAASIVELAHDGLVIDL